MVFNKKEASVQCTEATPAFKLSAGHIIVGSVRAISKKNVLMSLKRKAPVQSASKCTIQGKQSARWKCCEKDGQMKSTPTDIKLANAGWQPMSCEIRTYYPARFQINLMIVN